VARISPRPFFPFLSRRPPPRLAPKLAGKTTRGEQSKKARSWPPSPTASPPAAASTCAASTTSPRSPASSSPPPLPASRRGPPHRAPTLPRAPPRSTPPIPIPSPRRPRGGARRRSSRWPPWAHAVAPTAAARLRLTGGQFPCSRRSFELFLAGSYQKGR
jgi:hypothetical protein